MCNSKLCKINRLLRGIFDEVFFRLVEEELAETGGARRAMQLRLQSEMGTEGGGEDNRLSEEDLPTPHDVAGGLYLLEC